jgi:TPR repeat protein
MFKLYEMYTLFPVMANKRLALEYVVSAALAGHVDAAEVVGLYCVKRDEELARFWLGKAVEHDPERQTTLNQLGQEQAVSVEQYVARIAAAMAKITVL